MVVYDLICRKKHRFEGWFPSAEGYEEQAVRKEISCPVCGSSKVVKLLHACAIQTKTRREKEAGRPERPKASRRPLTEVETKEMLLHIHHHIRENFEDVGPRFAEEARKISTGNVEKRPIHGTATPKERDGLDEDGIPYLLLPKPELDS